jgi:hypothetical protein
MMKSLKRKALAAPAAVLIVNLRKRKIRMTLGKKMTRKKKKMKKRLIRK